MERTTNEKSGKGRMVNYNRYCQDYRESIKNCKQYVWDQIQKARWHENAAMDNVNRDTATLRDYLKIRLKGKNSVTEVKDTY